MDVGLGHLRVEGDRDQALELALGDGIVALLEAEALAVIGVVVDGEVVDGGADALLFEPVDDVVAGDGGAAQADDVEVPVGLDVRRGRSAFRFRGRR